MLPDEEKRALSKVRLEHARECLLSSRNLLKDGDFRGASNRAYYAVFHGMRAILALDGVDMKHHSGIITEFRRRYIKTGIFDRTLSEIIQIQSESRTSSDYDDFFVISREETAEQVESAAFFVETISEWLET